MRGPESQTQNSHYCSNFKNLGFLHAQAILQTRASIPDLKRTQADVPQGSALGPILFRLENIILSTFNRNVVPTLTLMMPQSLLLSKTT